MEAENTKLDQNRIIARLFDFIDLHPSHINHIFYSQQSAKLYVARKLYSQVFTVSEDNKNINIQQIIVFQPCQQIYEIKGLIVLVLPFQLKVNYDGRWIIYPFTTQLLPTNTKYNGKKNKLYTYHVNQCRQWTISYEQGVDFRHLGKHQIPFFINSQGILEGYGKSIKPSNIKQNKFTVTQVSECGNFLFIGSQKGQLNIYQTKYLTHIKTFHRHQAAILAIKSKENVCYFTGSDSKISCINFISENDQNNNKQGNWVLSKQVRGQSHDLMSLASMNFNDSFYILSGGITTDICLYNALDNWIPTGQWVHKIGYTSQKLAQSIGSYTIVNKYTSFQIWKVQQEQSQKSKQGIQLLVKYEMPFYKNIRQIISRQQGSSISIFIRTQQQATLWSFTQQQGLTKLITVKNNYNLSIWHKKQYIITIRDGNKLQLLNYKTGNIQQIAQISVSYPTEIKLSLGKQNKVLIASKFSNQIEVYKLNQQNKGKLITKLNLNQNFNILDFCYYNSDSLMIKYSSQNVIQQIDKNGNKTSQIAKIPVKKIRDFGWLTFETGQKRKIFWYAVSQGKIVIVSRMRMSSKARKVRVKQMPRIGNVVSRSTFKHKTKQEYNEQVHKLNQGWNLGVIPLNFSKMISEEINPILTKKII